MRDSFDLADFCDVNHNNQCMNVNERMNVIWNGYSFPYYSTNWI